MWPVCGTGHCFCIVSRRFVAPLGDPLSLLARLPYQVKSSSSQVELYCHSTTCVDI